MANRLAGETSPYLLQHAHNPVDWYPWGDEAFRKAATEDKPVLLSIGYAACHWCHVMERESFEDETTAALMNERFVNVKVDREERPDVDSIYMGAVQALTGHGGWPMTMFCAPDGTPFLGGTYFPPEERHGMPAFRTVLERVDELWRTRRSELLQQGTKIVETISRAAPAASNEPLQSSILSAAARQIVANHDRVHGGFGSAPKFPQAPVLEFLLRMQSQVPDVREAVGRTLTRMALGGIYDQLGGGFARYSVDERWLVPHFEKMLYDNAQLASVYLHAWQASHEPLYRRIATETLEYLLRDMRDAGGAFHSSEDADSEGEEGTFYVWDLADIPEDVRDYYGVTSEGNFEGRNILTAAGPEPPGEPRAQLLAEREKRIRPGKDDKVLASWNGLTIAAFAEAGAAFGREDFIQAAAQAASFVLDTMSTDEGRLLHTYRAGRAHVTGLLEDYAFVSHGLLALWEATFDLRWLNESRRLAAAAVDLCADPRAGGFFTTASDHEKLIVRQKEIIESATPAPGGVLAFVLQKLAVLFDAKELAKPAVDALRTARVYMERAAQAVPTWLSALDFYLASPVEVAFTGDAISPLTSVVYERFLPNRVLAAGDARDIALLKDKPADGEPKAWVCEHYVCRAPVSSPEDLARQLN